MLKKNSLENIENWPLEARVMLAVLSNALLAVLMLWVWWPDSSLAQELSHNPWHSVPASVATVTKIVIVIVFTSITVLIWRTAALRTTKN